MNYTEMKEIIDGAGDLSDDNREIFDEINEMVEEIEQNCEILKDWELSEDEYDNFLDDIYPEVNIGNMILTPSQVLYNCDRVAYNMGLGEEEDYKKEEMKETISDKIYELEIGLEEKDEKLIKTLTDKLDEVW